MAGGYKSALPLLGLSAPPVTIQAGYRSMLWRWGGGASAPVTVVQGGYRSLLAFWAGGAFSGTAVPPIPPVTPTYEGHGKDWKVDRTTLLRKDDEFVALFLASFTSESLHQS